MFVHLGFGGPHGLDVGGAGADHRDLRLVGRQPKVAEGGGAAERRPHPTHQRGLHMKQRTPVGYALDPLPAQTPPPPVWERRVERWVCGVCARVCE